MRLIVAAIALLFATTPAFAQEESGGPYDADSAGTNTPQAEASQPETSETKRSSIERMEAYTDPGTSTLIGVLVVGGGHFYSGETGKGLALLGVGVGAPFVATAISPPTTECDLGSGDCETTGAGAFYLGLAVSVGTWIYGIVDADDAARRANRRNGLAARSSVGVAPRVAVHDGQTGYGLQLNVQF